LKVGGGGKLSPHQGKLPATPFTYISGSKKKEKKKFQKRSSGHVRGFVPYPVAKTVGGGTRGSAERATLAKRSKEKILGFCGENPKKEKGLSIGREHSPLNAK